MASSCSECNNLFESKNKIKRWARTKRDAHTRKEGIGVIVSKKNNILSNNIHYYNNITRI